jgi:glutamate racemase
MKSRFILLVIVISSLYSCKTGTGKAEKADELLISCKALSDKESVWFADYAGYPQERKSLPVGIFDSGTGGLTVLEAFLSMDLFDNRTGEEKKDGIPDFAGENFVYLGDQANMPYGIYNSQGKGDYLRELIIKDALFLTTKENRSKILVIACNTATSYGFEDILSLFDKSGTGLQAVGVIKAGANASLDNLDPGDGVYIGVMATVGTISSGSYQKSILQLAKERGIADVPGITVQPGVGFAEAVDMEVNFIDINASRPRDEYKGPLLGSDSISIREDLMDRYRFSFAGNDMLFEKDAKGYRSLQINSAANYARFHLVSLIEKHRKRYPGRKLDNIILGCTHYPYLLDTLDKVVEELLNYRQGGVAIYKEVIADNFKFIDPSVYTAKETYLLLRKEGILNSRDTAFSLKAFISVPSGEVSMENVDSDGNFKFLYKYGRETGSEIPDTWVVPFSRENINAENLRRIEQRVPLSFGLISKIIE